VRSVKTCAGCGLEYGDHYDGCPSCAYPGVSRLDADSELGDGGRTADRFPVSVVSAYDRWVVSRSPVDLQALVAILAERASLVREGIANPPYSAALRSRFPEAAGHPSFKSVIRQIDDESQMVTAIPAGRLHALVHSARRAIVRKIPVRRSRRTLGWGLAVLVCLVTLLTTRAYTPILAAVGLVQRPIVEELVAVGGGGSISDSTDQERIALWVRTNTANVHVVRVIANGLQILVANDSGDGSILTRPEVTLRSGRNEILVTATDHTGWLQSTKAIVVLYYPRLPLGLADASAKVTKTRSATCSLRMRTEPGASVSVMGESKQATSDGIVAFDVPVDVGDNLLVAEASKVGWTTARAEFRVWRWRSDIAEREVVDAYLANVDSETGKAVQAILDMRKQAGSPGLLSTQSWYVQVEGYLMVLGIQKMNAAIEQAVSALAVVIVPRGFEDLDSRHLVAMRSLQRAMKNGDSTFESQDAIITRIGDIRDQMRALAEYAPE
jgi:hypothetical protein